MNGPTEREAMQWHTGNDYVRGRDFTPQQIVAWVNASGGEARYIEAGPLALATNQNPLIGVRTINGWDYAKPGDYVVIGSALIPQADDRGVWKPPLRDFHPCDPETFEKRGADRVRSYR